MFVMVKPDFCSRTSLAVGEIFSSEISKYKSNSKILQLISEFFVYGGHLPKQMSVE